MSVDTNNVSVDSEVREEITLDSIASRLDALGAQMDWLCTNLASLFGFVEAMGKNGGGIRGLMKAMKEAPPELVTTEGE